MRKLAFVAFSLALAGCQTMGLSGDPQSEPAAAPPVSAPSAAAPVLPGAIVASNGIVGMTGDALRAAWGEPSLKRTETGTEMWQYGGRGNCTLLVYFYANASNVMTVKHAEAVPGGADEAAVADCARAAGKPSLKPVS
jgi:hypothetical protein